MKNNLNLDDYKNYILENTFDMNKISTNSFQDNYDKNEEISIFSKNVLEAYSTSNDKVEFTKYSAVGPNILGLIRDAFDDETKDGQIGETKQHSTGNCWLLSGVNALSYTEKGKEIIKNSLEYHDGYTLVHLNGCGVVRVDDEDIAYTKGTMQYSSGDDDMIIFELAIEKAMDLIASDAIMVDPDAPLFIENLNLKPTEWHSSSTTGGWVNESVYYLTGKVGKTIKNKEEMKENLNAFEENNNKDLAMGASTDNSAKVKDINGKTINLAGNHAYSIKEVNDGVVTVINPWDSSKEINLDIDTFCNAFNSIDVIDLSEKNPKKNYISVNSKIDAEGNKRFIFENPYKEVQINRDPNTGNFSERNIYNEEGELIKQENWKYNKKGEKTSYTISTYQGGKRNGVIEYTYNPKTGEVKETTHSHYNENNQKIAVDEYGIDKNGKWGIQKRKNYDAETGKHITTDIYTYNDDGTYRIDTFDQKTGNNIKRNIYNENGKLVQTIIFNYDPETGEYVNYEIIDHK